MRHVPSTVTVITAFGEHADSPTPLPVGSAISSLTTVTLDPPHVSFNIKTPSTTLDAIRKMGGQFCVHLLDNSNLAARVAHNFTQGNSTVTLQLRKQKFKFTYPPTNHAGQPPKLVSSCVLASMTCQLVQEVTVADHVVAIASVNEVSARKYQAPALLYHEGKFKRYDGSTLHQQMPPARAPTFVGHAVYCSYPLFPGDAEKEDFISRAKDYVKQNQASFLESPSPGGVILKNEWGIKSGYFGLNLTRVVDQCMAELGSHSDQEPTLPIISLTHRFYGQLSPTDIIAIADHAKALVKRDPAALDGDYLKVLELLDVCPEGTNLLASDVLVPLREAGLIAPYEVRRRKPKAVEDIYYLEQVEHRLSAFLKTIPYEQAFRMKPNELQSAVGIKTVKSEQLDVEYLKQIRPRLTAEVYPEAFSPPQVDLRGQLSPEEVRVAVFRMVKALSVRTGAHYPSFIALSKAESLRRLGIHPMATGVDLDFVWQKMIHLRATVKENTAFEEAVDTMLDPMLERGTFELEDVHSRARKLVQSHALSVLNWSSKDKLAAMGLRYGAATVSLNGRDVSGEGLIRIVLKDALEARVKDDGITAEEKAAIDEYLHVFFAPKPKGWVKSATHGAKFSRPSVWSWGTRGVHNQEEKKKRDKTKKEEDEVGVPGG